MDETFTELLKELAHGIELRTNNLFILSRMDQASLKAFESVWPTAPRQRRRDIMHELVEIAEVNFEVNFDPVFLLALNDEDPEVRASAINGLWEHENLTLIPPLIHLLRTDEAIRVRAAAAIGLGRFLYMSELEEIDQNQGLLVKEALLATIYHPREDVEVRRRAIEAVAYSGDEDVTGIIEGAYYDENEKMQVSAVFAMGRNADKRWRPRVMAELDNPNNEIRFEAARACGELEVGEAVLRLIEMIEDEVDPEIQQMAIWALGRIGGPAARETLELCVDSDVEALALAAEEALDELNLFGDVNDMLMYDMEFDDEDFDQLFNLDGGVDDELENSD